MFFPHDTECLEEPAQLAQGSFFLRHSSNNTLLLFFNVDLDFSAQIHMSFLIGIFLQGTVLREKIGRRTGDGWAAFALHSLQNCNRFNVDVYMSLSCFANQFFLVLFQCPPTLPVGEQATPRFWVVALHSNLFGQV